MARPIAECISLKQTEEFIQSLNNEGFEVRQISEGCLLSGNYTAVKEGYYCFVILEKYLNEWSSAYNVYRYKTLPEKYQNIG